MELAEEGKLTVHVDRTFPLDQAAQAQQLLALRPHPGKIILENRKEVMSNMHAQSVITTVTDIASPPEEVWKVLTDFAG